LLKIHLDLEGQPDYGRKEQLKKDRRITMTTEQESPEVVNTKTSSEAVIREKLIDAMTPGFQAEFDPDEAEQAGAFIEDALSEEDAMESDVDLFATLNPDKRG
jgi:hypothetical protein